MYKIIQTIKNEEKILAEFPNLDEAEKYASELENSGAEGCITVESWSYDSDEKRTGRKIYC